MEYKTSVGSLVDIEYIGGDQDEWLNKLLKASGVTFSKWKVVSCEDYEGPESREIIFDIQGEYAELIKFIKWYRRPQGQSWTNQQIEMEYEIEKVP